MKTKGKKKAVPAREESRVSVVLKSAAVVVPIIWYILASLNEGSEFVARLTGGFGTILVGA